MNAKEVCRSDVPLNDAILVVCEAWAKARSKDPSSKVGACIYDPNTGGMFLGYNGFPSALADLKEWWDTTSSTEPSQILKYDLVIHAEMNAVHKALKAGVDVSKCALYCTHHPCEKCMRDVVALTGIKVVYFVNDTYRSFGPRSRYVCEFIAKSLGIQLIRMRLP